MKLSLITATFNNHETIRRCLDSVSAQTYKDIEHIIVDGQSTDGTLDLISEYRNKDARVISEQDSGVYDALNKGISLSSGDIIGFLHSDDYFSHSEVLTNIVQCFSSEKVDGVYGDIRYVNGRGDVFRYWKSGDYNPKLIRKGWMPPHTSLFLRNTVYQSSGLFDLEFKISADYDLVLRMLYRDKISLYYLPDVLIEMQTGGMSNRSIKNIIQKSSEDLRALRKNKLSFPLLILLNKNLSKLPQLFRR